MRKSAIGIMCALTLAAAGANTWWVEDEGGVDAAGRGSEAAPFQTIQYAIDTASAGVVPNAAEYEASDPISRNWHVYCHADVEGNPIRFNTDGTAMVGASQNPVPVRTAFTVFFQ